MSFSNKWEKIYKKKSNYSIWPWSEVISLFYNHFNLNKFKNKKIKILELGCGAGANIPFFYNKKFDYYGVDGSQTIIKALKTKYPNLKKKIKSCDFTKEIPFKEEFDLILDRASITCNSKESIISAINLIQRKLKKKGFFFGIDWYSTKSSDFKKGKMDGDKFTRKDIKNSIFSGAGSFHFSNEKMMRNYFKKFKIISFYEKIIYKKINKPNKLASWTIVVEK